MRKFFNQKKACGFYSIVFLVVSLFIMAGVALNYWQTSSKALQSTLFNYRLLNVQEGQLESLEKWRGKPLLVYFWATWCATCVADVPEMIALQKYIQEQNGEILAIALDSKQAVQEFSSRHKLPYPIYVGDQEGLQLATELNQMEVPAGVPFLVLIDKHGKIRHTYIGKLYKERVRRDFVTLG